MSCLTCRLLKCFCSCIALLLFFFFFFNDTATTEIYTLSLHALFRSVRLRQDDAVARGGRVRAAERGVGSDRSEEHTSELQSQSNLVCRLLLEKKKKSYTVSYTYHEYNADGVGSHVSRYTATHAMCHP